MGSALDRHRKEIYGNHEVKFTVDRRSTTGLVGVKDIIEDERVNRRHTAWSDMGTLVVEQPGEYSARLSATKIAKEALAGFTATGVRLILDD